MAEVFLIPELLDLILTETIACVIYDSWLCSLRLVNHAFNDALLKLYFVHDRARLSLTRHRLDCSGYCYFTLCDAQRNIGRDKSYVARMTLHGLLARQSTLKGKDECQRLICTLRAAITTLREEFRDKTLYQKALEVKPVCSSSAVFNDPTTTVITRAIVCLLGSAVFYLGTSQEAFLIEAYGVERQPCEFWVALSACVLGDASLFSRYSSCSHAAQDQSKDGASLRVNSFFFHVAACYHRGEILACLLQLEPEIMAKSYSSFVPLQSIIKAGDETLLAMVLQHTPKSARVLSNSCSFSYNDPNPRNEYASIFRMLYKHFTPFPMRAFRSLLRSSCIRGDTCLLKKLLAVAPLLSERVELYNGIFPTVIHLAVRSGSLETLCALLDWDFKAYIEKNRLRSTIASAQRCALSYNRIDMYNELCYRVGTFRSNFVSLGWADGAEGAMQRFISKKMDIWKSSLGEKHSSAGQQCLSNAATRLRYGNVKFLLEAGVRPPTGSGAYKVNWLRFIREREVFHRIGELLEAYGLPKLLARSSDNI